MSLEQEVQDETTVQSKFKTKKTESVKAPEIKVENKKREIIFKFVENSTYTKVDGKQSNIRTTLPIDKGAIKLFKDNVYILPITDSELDFDSKDSHAIKISRQFRMYFDILDVGSGFVWVQPYFNEFKIIDGMVIGEII